jgi:hypothetical protein
MIHDMPLAHEARLLSSRTGLRAEACEKWMRHVGINGIPDLMHRYPGVRHAECMMKAGEEIEAFILA